MKVVLNSFGVMEDKEFINKIKSMTEFQWRTDEGVIALIEKRQREIKYLLNLKECKDFTESQQHRLNELTNWDRSWLYFQIVDVDTSRKWAIADYDSSTHIQYLEVADEDLNFYGFI